MQVNWSNRKHNRTYSPPKSTITRATNRLGNALIIAIPSHTSKYYGTPHIQYKEKVNVIPATEMGRHTTESTNIPSTRINTSYSSERYQIKNVVSLDMLAATTNHAAFLALRLAQYAQTLYLDTSHI